MALWGNDDNVTSTGTVSLNYSTGAVTGSGTTFVTDLSVGQVIRFGVNVGTGTYFGDAVITGITSATLLTIGSTENLSGAAIASTDFTVSTPPKSSIKDSSFSQTNTDYDSFVYGVAAGGVANAEGSEYETGAGWVGVTTYLDTHGNLRVKKEILVAMSGISTGNAPIYDSDPKTA